MFKPVTPKLNVTLMEEAMLRFWKSHQVPLQAARLHAGGPQYVLLEGPLSAAAHIAGADAQSRVYKDLFSRYKSMRGFQVARRGAWDGCGLAVEFEVEEALGLAHKSQIEGYGLEHFNAQCRRVADDWAQSRERFAERLAFWPGMQLDPADGMDPQSAIESVWGVVKCLWEQGLLYQSFKVVPYCPRCGTPLADQEAAQGSGFSVDAAVFVRLPLVGQPGTSLLVWTPAPWTLTANVAVAAAPEVEYVSVEHELAEGGKERLIVARRLLEKLSHLETLKVVDAFKGRALKGKRYQPLFTFLPPDKPAYRVVMADSVPLDEGTGLMLVAPAFGEKDLQLALDQDLPILTTIGEDGAFIAELRPWSGKLVRDADAYIIQDLDNRGLLLRSEETTRAQATCWTCGTTLMNTARPTWFMRTSTLKERMLALSAQIDWRPAQEDRFHDWLESGTDWALGRERFWGTPLPIWECGDCHQQECMGSRAELSERAGRSLDGQDLHRPYVDQIHLTCAKCGGTMRRVAEITDGWFEAAALGTGSSGNPDATWQHPVDFVCENLEDQRGWFYILHAIATTLFEEPAFHHAIGLGKAGPHTMDGRMDVREAVDLNGADATRWYLYTPGLADQGADFSADEAGKAVNGFVHALWSVYAFFIIQANSDHWQPNSEASFESSDLDRWLLSELNVLVRDVTQAYEAYDVQGATRPIGVFVEHLANGYLRRSRRRFWKNETATDRAAAYATLYQTLTTLAGLLAPSMPFLAEELYQNLVRSPERSPQDGGDPLLSVHLTDWPSCDEALIDELLNDEMEAVRKLAAVGHIARSKTSRKLRQPLAEAAFSVGSPEEARLVEKYALLLADELNVKQVRLLGALDEAVTYSLQPMPEQLGRKYHERYPAIRQAIVGMPSEAAAQRLLAGESLLIEVDGQRIEILPDEVEVSTHPKAGLVVASAGSTLVAVDTQLTGALMQEGLAREFIRHVQDLRKQSELSFAERIRVVYTATPGLDSAIQAFRETILTETLAAELHEGEIPHGVPTTVDEFEGEKIRVGIIRR